MDTWEDDMERSERRPGPVKLGLNPSGFRNVRRCSGPFLTQVADVFSELLERHVQAFGVAGDFGGVQHEGHAVDLLPQARPLYVADSLRRIHRLIWAELVKEEERSRAGAGCYRGNGS